MAYRKGLDLAQKNLRRFGTQSNEGAQLGFSFCPAINILIRCIYLVLRAKKAHQKITILEKKITYRYQACDK